MKEGRAESVKIGFPVEGLWSTFYRMFWKNCCLYCSTTPVAERFFTSSTSLTLKHAAWYPGELLDPHIVLLTSDNVMRCSVSVSVASRGVGCGAVGWVTGRHAAWSRLLEALGPSGLSDGPHLVALVTARRPARPLPPVSPSLTLPREPLSACCSAGGDAPGGEGSISGS